MGIITFLSDFGMNSGYVAQMKGIVSCITDAQLIDISHDITPHNIREGAFILRNAAQYFPVSTVHVAVIDPGVGTERKGLIITTKSQILVGPDNGILLPTARFFGGFTVYDITNTDYILEHVSNTFHGRDVFAPTAAHIANGVPFDKLGVQTHEFVDLVLRTGEISTEIVTGEIMHIDRFGNLVTNINGIDLLSVVPFNTKLKLVVGGKRRILSFVQSYGSVKTGALLATIGGSNMVEVSVNSGHAAHQLAANLGDPIILQLS